MKNISGKNYLNYHTEIIAAGNLSVTGGLRRQKANSEHFQSSMKFESSSRSDSLSKNKLRRLWTLFTQKKNDLFLRIYYKALE